MEEQLLALASEQGIWVLLSMVLLVYILKKQETRDKAQEERERNYQELLAELTEKFDILTGIQNDVAVIKDCIEKKAENS